MFLINRFQIIQLKIFFTSILILSVYNIGRSQPKINWQNPLPQGNGLHDVFTFSRDTAIAVGSPGTIIKTTDGGNNWDIIHYAREISGELYTIFFVGNLGWAAGANGKIIFTDNCGLSWESQNSSTINALFDIYFIDENTGWTVGANGTILKTTDAGSTWTLQNSGTTNNLESVYFLDQDSGYAVGNSGTILATTKGGETWSAQNSGTTKNLNSISFTENGFGIIVGDQGQILLTEDRGTSWTPKSVDETLESVCLADTCVGWAAGWDYNGHGVVYKIIDTGKKWIKQNINTDNLLYAIDCSDTAAAWTVGAIGQIDENEISANIFRTINSGREWQSLSKGTAVTLNNSCFIDNDTGWVVGDWGTLLHTTNGGNDWQIQTPSFADEARNLADCYFINQDTGWVIGSQGFGNIIYKTTDGGESWEQQTSGVYENLNAIYFVNNDKGWIAGSGGLILHTSSGGTDWDQQTTGVTNYLISLYFIDDSIGWACGMDGQILKTRDGGQNWISQTSGVTTDLNTIFFIDSTHGWAAGSNMNILKTTDGGESWTAHLSGISIITSLCFIDRDYGWASGWYGGLIRTKDGGHSWETILSGTNISLTSIHFTDKNNGWVTGNYGIILKIDDPIENAIGENIKLPNKASLLQNYPNPFNPATTIKYILTEDSQVKISVYDINGKLVNTLINSYKTAGSHTIIWHAEDFPSGIYLYRIEAGDFSDVRKGVLMK